MIQDPHRCLGITTTSAAEIKKLIPFGWEI
jgi:hypothetical protein